MSGRWGGWGWGGICASLLTGSDIIESTWQVEHGLLGHGLFLCLHQAQRDRGCCKCFQWGWIDCDSRRNGATIGCDGQQKHAITCYSHASVSKTTWSNILQRLQQQRLVGWRVTHWEINPFHAVNICLFFHICFDWFIFLYNSVEKRINLVGFFFFWYEDLLQTLQWKNNCIFRNTDLKQLCHNYLDTIQMAVPYPD